MVEESCPVGKWDYFPHYGMRILAGVDEELFALEFMEWIGEILDIRGIHLAIAQLPIQNKDCEIPAIPELFLAI